MLKNSPPQLLQSVISKGLHFFGSRYLCQSDKAAYTFSEKEKSHLSIHTKCHKFNIQ